MSDLQWRRSDLHRPRDDGRRHHGLRGVRGPAVPGVGAGIPAPSTSLRAGGLNIAEVLDLSVRDAVGFFGAGKAQTPAAHAILQRMADVGLGYLRLGQPLTTLSGGERQRLKLATHMGEEGGVFVLDELTTGLHLADIEPLLGLLDRLVDSGRSIIVIEHHLTVMAHADWIIDLGPGAGHDGGRVVFEGTPADLVAARSTLTRQAPGGLRLSEIGTLNGLPAEARRHSASEGRVVRYRDGPCPARGCPTRSRCSSAASSSPPH